MRSEKRKQAVILAVLTLMILLLAFLLSGRVWFRIDLTHNKIYTVSEYSRGLFRELADTVTVTYFVSDRLALAYPQPGIIADLLREYAAHSGGKLRFIQRDPAAAGLVRMVEDLGIVPWQIQITERNETTLATVYSGILIEYLNREAVIPIALSRDTLEYEVFSRILSLIRNTEREIGVIVGDANKQWLSDYALLNRDLYLSGFRVSLISPGDWMPPELPVLFVLGGAEDLDLYDLYPIDAYIMGGGNVLFAVDGVFVNSGGSLESRPVMDMGLLTLLANYGVIVRRDMVMDVTALPFSFEAQSGNGVQIHTVRYPHWISVQKEGANPGHPVSARFGGLDLYWASPLELHPPQGVNGEVLFTSTAQAWLQTEEFITNPNMVSIFDSESFERQRHETTGVKILAASLSGNFPGAFEDSPPAASRPGRIIVVGDSDFAGPIMQATRADALNLDFLIRAAEWLSGNDELLAIRPAPDEWTEGGGGRLDRIADRETRDALMAFSRTLNTFVIPLAVAAAGFIICTRRRSRKARGPVKEKGKGSSSAV